MISRKPLSAINSASRETERREAPTADQLRHALDHGEGGDKRSYPDPAAAPLGTDDEAGGDPPTRQQLRTAFEQETGRAQTEPHSGGAANASGVLRPFFVLALAFVVFLLAAALAVVFL